MKIKNLKDAVKIIDKAEEYIETLENNNLELSRQIYLYPCNEGGHFYPGLEDPCGEGYLSCKCNYCDETVLCDERYGPVGVWHDGECKGNPKAKDAYFELKKLYDRKNI